MESRAFNAADFYTIDELAEQLAITTNAIMLWRQSGKIPGKAVVKYRETLYFRCDVIDPLIDAGALLPEEINEQNPPHDSDELKRNRAVALLPFHFDRYMDFFLRRQAGIVETSRERTMF